MAININHQTDTICATGGTLNLPDFSAAGFSQDSQGNLVAGTGAGASKDADTCFNIMIGCNAGASYCAEY